MANFRRNRPKDGGPRNGEWSHPPVEKGRYKFSSVANKRRALVADSTPTKRVSITVPDTDGIDYQYLWDYVEVPVGVKIEDDHIGQAYDPLDTTQFIPKRKRKPKLNREQRAVKRAQRLIEEAKWNEWFNEHIGRRTSGS